MQKIDDVQYLDLLRDIILTILAEALVLRALRLFRQYSDGPIGPTHYPLQGKGSQRARNAMAAVVAHRLCGWSIRRIAAFTGLSKSTVARDWNKYVAMTAEGKIGYRAEIVEAKRRLAKRAGFASYDDLVEARTDAKLRAAKPRRKRVLKPAKPKDLD